MKAVPKLTPKGDIEISISPETELEMQFIDRLRELTAERGGIMMRSSMFSSDAGHTTNIVIGPKYESGSIPIQPPTPEPQP